MTATPSASSGQSVVDAVRTLARDRRLRIGLTVAAIAYLVVRAYLMLTSDDSILGADAYTYWSAPYDDPYRGPQLGLPGAYLYPPPFLQALAPLRLLPWEVFQALWAAAGLVALVYLVGPIGAALAITFLPFVFRDLLVGNIHLMLAAAIVIGMRRPAIWAFPILTKITPGIGVLWFVARGNWRAAGIAIVLTAAASIASFALAPHLWDAWFDRMSGDTGTAGPGYLVILVIRVALAAILVIAAGRTNRPWLLPIAILVSLPILWPDSLAILLAAFPLMAREFRSRGTR